MSAAPKGLQISTPTDTTIVLTRTFNAPRRLVWEAIFSPGISLIVKCKDQAEVDLYWNKFIAGGGREANCGWL